MTISIHMQTKFDDYNYFKKKMDEILVKYPTVSHCLCGRSKALEYAKKYFKDTQVECVNPKLSRYKIQNLYKIIEQSDLTIFFYRKDIKIGSNLTSKSITRAKNLKKDYVIIEY